MSNEPELQATPSISFNEKPIQCICTHCHSSILTHVERSSGLLVWLLCCILVLFGCWLGCCLVPFCIRDIQNTQHYCPNCRAFLGEYRPL